MEIKTSLGDKEKEKNLFIAVIMFVHNEMARTNLNGPMVSK